MRAALIPVLLTSACVLRPAEWQAERDKVVCAIAVDCFDLHPSREACLEAAATESEPPCPTLRLGATWQCLDELRAQRRDCPERMEAWQIPTVCASTCADGTDS